MGSGAGQRPWGPSGGRLHDFLEWRRRHITSVVVALADSVRHAGLRTALDVFTPALAYSVGQDIEAIASDGEWAETM